jgi:CHAT domain-containing protein
LSGNGTAQETSGSLAIGAASYARGDFAKAIEHFSEGVAEARALADKGLETDALARRADAYQALGFLEQAAADLNAAIALLDETDSPEREIRLRGSLGNVHTLIGNFEDARAELGLSRLQTLLLGDRELEARTLINIGNFLLVQRRYEEAIKVYASSNSLAAEVGSLDLQWITALNEGAARIELEDYDIAEASLQRGNQILKISDVSARTAHGLITLGSLVLKLENRSGETNAPRRHTAYSALQQSHGMAAGFGNDWLVSYALGYLGQLYERDRRYEEGRQLTRRAIFLAQQIGAPESLYLWQWQLGRIMEAEGQVDTALEAYGDAVETLRLVRADLIAGFGGGRAIFEDSVRPLIMDLTNLLLKRAGGTSNREEFQATLIAARDTVELLKAAELEDYFHDNCLAAFREKEQRVDKLPPASVALYPVMLPDRLEIILSREGGLERIVVPVGEAEIDPIARQFVRGLKNPGSDDYLLPAQQLYSWLISPILPKLKEARTETLVIVSSGSLATVPFAALNDGREFLIEQYSVAVAPGLTLIDAEPIDQQEVQALVGGLSQSVAGFDALPHVVSELAAIDQAFPSEVLSNENFLKKNLHTALAGQSYGIVHMATHAEFRAESADSFLLTYDGTLTMEGLEDLVKLSRFREEPVDLLTLSACSTAEGDIRAALGLAGIGIKAGARSALASLWSINDASTATLISKFYENLGQAGITKAEALRRAQLAFVHDPRYGHPLYWAPFLLIGNWL